MNKSPLTDIRISSLWHGRRASLAFSIGATLLGLSCGSLSSWLIMRYAIGDIIRLIPALRMFLPDAISVGLLCLVAGLVIGFAHLRHEQFGWLRPYQQLFICLLVTSGSILIGRSVFWLFAAIAQRWVDRPFFLIAGWLTWIVAGINLLIGGRFGALIHRLQQFVLEPLRKSDAEWITTGRIIGSLGSVWGTIIGALTYGIYRVWA